MIYTRFHGRTGNQMFQYAAGRALSLKLGVDLVLDDRLSIHKGEKSLTRVFDLPVATHAKMPPSKHNSALGYAFWRHVTGRSRYYRERGLGFDPELLDQKDGTYLHGYWQSERYFSDIRAQILQDFTFPEATGKNAELAAQISETLSVSLHVRRGDYISNASHVVCGQSYYDAALAALTPQLEATPTIYVFSDEPDWARDNLSLPGTPVIVDHNGADTDYEDLRLMSLCKHNIVANSSFSWWSAWLNQNAGRRVIAPNRWFGKDSLNNPDIWADGWIKAG
ncbi:MAG: alpha-1,2-fucosyltransferase [Thalassovita sp.]